MPIAPVPVIYWAGDWVGLIPGGARPASDVLRMVLSWIAVSPVVSSKPGIVRVFSSIDDFAYLMCNPDAGAFYRDVKSQVTPFWDAEVIALTQFADDALRLDEPIVAFGMLSRLVETYPEFLSNTGLRDAVNVVAHACGDEPFSSDAPATALDHFKSLKAEWDEQRPFRELDQFEIRAEVPLNMQTGSPVRGTFNCILQEPPDVTAICAVCCMLLSGVETLRQCVAERQTSLESSLTAEAKAAMTLKHSWHALDEPRRHMLSQWFCDVTGRQLSRQYDL